MSFYKVNSLFQNAFDTNATKTGDTRMNIKAGLISGFITTVVLSILMLTKAKMDNIISKRNDYRLLAKSC